MGYSFGNSLEWSDAHDILIPIEGKTARKSCCVFLSPSVKREIGMKKSPASSSERPGTPCLDIFKIAGQSISGYIPGLKTGDKLSIRLPYTSLPEQMLAMYQVSDSTT